MGADRRRLLLVEFIRADPFRNLRGEHYPFLQGFAAERGIPTLWVRVGIGREPLSGNPFIIDLPPPDIRALLGTLRSFRPTHAVFNDKLSASLDERVRRARPALEVFFMADFPRARLAPAWLGLADGGDAGGGDLFQASPDYRSRPLNSLAGTCRPFIKVFCGSPCGYRRSLARNPCFAGLDLSRATRDFGCSFCGDEAYEDPRLRLEDHLALVRRQLESAAAALGPSGPSPGFMLTGAAAFLGIKDFFAAIERMPLPPAEFYFSCRVDEFLARSGDIRGLLPRLRERGHSIHLHNMGVENFSAAENRRLNKGISERQVLKAHGILADLEARYPDTFFFRRHGGFGFILFTPWTTLPDLAVNLRAAQKIGVDADSFFFRSRLQLMPGRPVTLLAERERLTMTAFAAAMDFNSGCIERWDQRELPWRFRHPAIGIIYAILSRWGVRDEHDAAGVRDPLYGKIQAVRGTMPAERGATWRIFEALLEAMAETPAPRTVAQALRAAVKRCLAQGPRLPTSLEVE